MCAMDLQVIVEAVRLSAGENHLGRKVEVHAFYRQRELAAATNRGRWPAPGARSRPARPTLAYPISEISLVLDEALHFTYKHR